MLKWTKELVSGFEDLDRQHRLVIICVRKLFSAIEKGESSEKILSIIEKFDNYVTEHFETEEKYAEDYNFPKLEELKKEHEFFKSIYYNLRYHYSYYDTTSEEPRYIFQYAIHLTKTLEEWLIFHINTLDQELIDFLKTKF